MQKCVVRYVHLEELSIAISKDRAAHPTFIWREFRQWKLLLKEYAIGNLYAAL